MADRSTAEAFGTAFRVLAKHVSAAKDVFDPVALVALRAAAEEIYDEQDGQGDYTPDQMDADEALVTLGLAAYRPAWDVLDADERDGYDEDDKIICYRGED